MMDFSGHPWMSGLFGDEELAAIFAPEAECQRLVKVEAAWTRALGEIESVDVEVIAQTLETCTIAPEALKDGFARDGLPIPALVKILKEQVDPDALQWVHTGLTSQDVMDTSLMLALADILNVFETRVTALDQKLAALQGQFGGAKIMAYTRMQPALETNAAGVIGAWRQSLPVIMEDLAKTQAGMRFVQWGGPIGIRDHPQPDALGAAFARQLGMFDPGMAWHTDRTRITKAAQLMTRIATATGKVGEDIALMAAVGPDQIALIGGGSSAMAHKNNPVKAEVLIALSEMASTYQSNLTRSARHEGSRSGQAWTLEWLALPQLSLATGAGLLQCLELLGTIKSIGRS